MILSPQEIITQIQLPNEIVQCNTDTGRFYKVWHGDRVHELVSVTSLKSKYENKEALFAWRNRIGNEAADSHTQKSANRGTQVHHWFENWCRYRTHPMPEESEAYQCWLRLTQLFPILNPVATEHRTFWVNEHGHGFAGTLDLLTFVDGSKLLDRALRPIGDTETLLVADLKTWNKAKYPVSQTREGKKYFPLIGYGLQIAAYLAALNQRSNSQLRINKGLIIGLTSNCKSPFMYFFNPEAICFFWQNWKQMLNCHVLQQWFDWELFERQAFENGFLGERVDLCLN